MAWLDDNGVITLTSEIKDHVDERYLTNVSITPVYSATSAYSVGDCCLKDGSLYRCVTTISSPGEPWNALHWTLTSVVNETKRNNFTNNLLWENASPTGAFAAQTIQLDLSNYMFVKICFLWYVGDSTLDTSVRFIQDFEIGTTGVAYRNDVSETGSNYWITSRRITINNSSITFNDCRQVEKGSTYSILNIANVPYKIYGIV